MSADSQETSRALADKLGIEFPMLSDPQLEVVRAYGIEEVGKDIARPATFVLDADGRVLFAHVGKVPGDRPLIKRMFDALPGG